MPIERYQGSRYEKSKRNTAKMRDDFKDYVNSNKYLLHWQKICVQHTGRVKEGD